MCVCELSSRVCELSWCVCELSWCVLSWRVGDNVSELECL